MAAQPEQDLSDFDLALLAFEKRTWRYGGVKQQAILREFNLSETRYYQEVWRLIQDPRVVALEPALVHRLRRIALAPTAPA
ncbi:DUF3263 domain-containing protein [Micrococcales bacterium 31B]|nr:DUF3263 domain-containing protein [Micrococcales bacterium 31B]